MKRFISLLALLISISFFLSHGTSFSNTKIRNDATLTIVPEEQALIAITYEKGGNFSATNNTAKTINITNIKVVNQTDQAVITEVKKVPSTIHPGRSQQFTITGDPKVLTGKVIRLTAHWNGGSAKVNSIIPKLIGKNTVEESTDKATDQESVEEYGDNVNQETNEEKVSPESEKEENDSEVEDEIIEPEIDEDN